MKPKIIFINDELIVLDKPAGMPSVRETNSTKYSLADWILGKFPEQKSLPKGEDEAGLIYRLDNDTSGVIIASRTENIYKRMRSLWQGRAVLKEYRCLVVGLAPLEGEITTPIAHHPKKANKMMVVSDEKEAEKYKAREAKTFYKLLETYVDYSLLEVRITTGLRHQIRCHLASIGYPIVGDKLYQREKYRQLDRFKLDRHFLHASRVRFVSPMSGKFIEFTSELPAELKRVLKSL